MAADQLAAMEAVMLLVVVDSRRQNVTKNEVVFFPLFINIRVGSKRSSEEISIRSGH